MTEIASLHASTRTPDGGRFTATFAINDDGTVTRRITSVDGIPVDNKPARFRVLGEERRRRYCGDAVAAVQYLAGVVATEGWMVTPLCPATSPHT